MVFVTARSADKLIGSLSVALLFPGVGSVVPPGTAMAAVLLSDPDEAELTVPLMLKVTVAPGARLMSWLIEPLPDGAAHAPPADAEQVHVPASNPAGNVSETVAPVTDDGPTFEATIV